MCLIGHHLMYISQWLAWCLNINFYLLVKKKQLIPPLKILSKYCISIIKAYFYSLNKQLVILNKYLLIQVPH